MGDPIKILVAGGTFDKEYDEIEQKLTFNETHIPEMLQDSRCRADITVRVAMLIDSLDMTETDRLLILEQCEKAEEERIVITHGTDTMVKTAQLLGENIKDKTIVLTGAMVPFIVSSSDSIFNLGVAIGFVQVLPPGVYVAMNGLMHPWYNVQKNMEDGVFKTLEE